MPTLPKSSGLLLETYFLFGLTMLAIHILILKAYKNVFVEYWNLFYFFRHTYSCTKENSELLTFSEHKKSCRALKFSPSGEELHTASKDKAIHTLDLNTAAVKRKIKHAHE